MKLVEMSVEGFLSELGSDSPAPGGGSAAALAGATAAALCVMVCRLTLGREKYRSVWAELEEARAGAERLGARLRALVDEDAEAFLAVGAARKLPRETESDRAVRERAVQAAVLRSASVPLETLQSIALLAGPAVTAVERGNPGCVTDAGSAALMIRAGALGAAWNVRVNLPLLKALAERQRLQAAVSKALSEAVEAAVKIEDIVEKRLSERSES
jgi:formiminotetrahydrofolate cyclodeaminase